MLWFLTFIAGGNQRDLAREKGAKKQQEKEKSKSAAEKEGNKGMSLEARKQRWIGSQQGIMSHSWVNCVF